MIIKRKLNLKITLSDLKKTVGLTLVVLLFVSGFYVFAEPGMVRALTTDTQTVVVTLSVTAGVTLTVDNLILPMSNAITVAVNSATATSSFIVTTNDYLGYTLKLNATNTPAMSSYTGGNVVPDGTVTPALWSSVNAAGTSTFAFSAYSTSTAGVSTATFGTVGAGGCSSPVGTPSGSLKYRGFAGATQVTIAGNTSTTTPSGAQINVCYAVGQNGAFIPSGDYRATVVATATTN